MGFYEHGKLEKSLKTSVIALIPRKIMLPILEIFSFISLVGSLCKFLVKVFANWLKRELDKLDFES